MTSQFTVRAEAMPAWVALGAALEHTRTPCQVDPVPFVSDDVEERREAAQACAGCQVVTLCASFATANQEGAWVWGGRDHTPRPYKRAGAGGDVAC